MRVETRGAAIWLTLDRPEALNGISSEIIDAFDAFLESLDRGELGRPHAIVVTGSGRAFCTGGEMKGMEDGEGGYRSAAHIYANVSRILRRLELLPMPVVAAVNGLCVAGGLEIALACDLVIATESARFGDGHANFGLIPGAGGTVRLPRRIGLARARYMMYTAKLFPAATMLDWGLVNEVCDDAALVRTVDALTHELAQRSPLGIALMKRLTADGETRTDVDLALRNEIDACKEHDATEDRAEGLAAFAQKRTPMFVGR